MGLQYKLRSHTMSTISIIWEKRDSVRAPVCMCGGG